MGRFYRRRKSRPRLKDALEYHAKGSYSGGSSEDYVTAQERVTRLSEVKQEIDELVKRHIPRSTDLTLVLLKCHIILEFVANRFLELAAPTEVDFTKERFTFIQKITLLHAFGLPPDPVILPTLELLNELRNQAAHSLSIDRQKLDLLIRLNSDDPSEAKGLDDKARAKWLKAITQFTAGVIIGNLEGLHLDAFAETHGESLRAEAPNPALSDGRQPPLRSGRRR